MKTIRLCWIIVLIMFLQPSSSVVARDQEAPGKRVPRTVALSAFEPLDHWKAAVFSGDQAAIAGFYSTSPPAGAQTPQGETQDPSEEPAFWSSFGKAGLSRLDLKVLEVKHPQPGVVTFVLRFEVDLQNSAGKKSGVISGAQVWVQQNGVWRILSTRRSDLAPSAPRRLPEPTKPNTHLYPAPEEAPAEIAAALRASTKDHKRVILVFGGNWCYDCHVLDATFRSKEIAPLVNENYHVVHVNIGNYDKNLDLANKYDVPLDKGVPGLAILDSDGTLVVSQKKGEFESTTRIGPEDVVEFLKRWKPRPGG
jgi:thioredoxin 1